MSITIQTGRTALTPAAMPSFTMRMLTLLRCARLCLPGTFSDRFVSRLVVPKTINSGPASSLPTALLINLVLMSIFAVQHSGMARQGFKRLFARFASPAIERSTYVLLASLSLILLFWQWQPMPTVVWNIEARFAGVRPRALPGWLIVLCSTFLISHLSCPTQVVTYLPGA